ncbi:MAG: ADP-ribosyl-[dinitrogen reductase] hydrolase [Lentimonas sp.]|jgi:ADP-ribosyl-[dinitrogen reductase] hydrolase
MSETDLPIANEVLHHGMLGALVADAVSMPVHWYYDTRALDQDYGELRGYVAPKNPHSGSILWRSKYKARNPRGDILHDQVQYWGVRGIHYHQFLKAGENTINYQLGHELYRSTVSEGRYDPETWLDCYVRCMLEPGWHRDTYVEEYHRAFFDKYARGMRPIDCGIDDLHIGGLSHVPCLLAALERIGITDPQAQRNSVKAHVQLTHRSRYIVEAAEGLTLMLQDIKNGSALRTAIAQHGALWVRRGQFETWSAFEDRSVVGRHLSPACYLPESFTASLYLAWKYADDFGSGVLANARCGGDNCHRGAVVGSLLAAANGIPQHWLDGLLAREPLANI